MARPPLYLVGAREIGVLLGDITRQRAYQIASRPDFPDPIADLAQGKVWLGAEVEAWVAANPGVLEPRRRPRRVT
ncbi:DNA-binding protein [Actinoplanes subglobosus]|uniref:DNA-binding protein n=1 Tax=Actinoplanes subglobosus TaxID=1547892 RepID=A0ABV8J7K5_9ACTN